MPNNAKNSTSMAVDNAEIGSVSIADDVLARIAGLAALEIDGVSAVAGNITRENLPKVRRQNLVKGVKVSINDNKVAADLSLVMAYGFNIPATCKHVQSRVRNTVTNMTGLEVTDVNVSIAGIKMDQDA